MARGSRPEKVQEWSHRLQRFEDSSLTVAQFCRAEHVSEQSYYHWKKKLRDASAVRVLRAFLAKDMGRWLPLVVPERGNRPIVQA